MRREELVHALVAEYAPGTPLGWHRDVPNFEVIAGVSLGNNAVLRFRPYPPDGATKRRALELGVAPRSIYAIQGEARWGWQHSVPPVSAMRCQLPSAREGRLNTRHPPKCWRRASRLRCGEGS